MPTTPMLIELRPVQSSHVSGIGYNPERQELHVAYRGRRAVYYNVPADVAEAVMDSPSIGQALRTWVRGNYLFGYVTAQAEDTEWAEEVGPADATG